MPILSMHPFFALSLALSHEWERELKQAPPFGWRPEALHEGPREAGIGQRRGCRDRVYEPGRLHPATGRIFLRKTLLLPSRSPSLIAP